MSSSAGGRRAAESGAGASDAPAQSSTLSYDILLPFLALYIVISICVFGIFVPSGNFIPALTIGCGMGRLVRASINCLCRPRPCDEPSHRDRHPW